MKFRNMAKKFGVVAATVLPASFAFAEDPISDAIKAGVSSGQVTTRLSWLA